MLKFAFWCFVAGYIAAALIGFWPVFYALIVLGVLWWIFGPRAREEAARYQERPRYAPPPQPVGPDTDPAKKRKAWWK